MQSKIEYLKVDTLHPNVYIEVMRQSGLGEQRPVDDPDRIARMLQNSNLILLARDTETNAVVGVARSVTDYAWCCYLSDLAVSKSHQGRGIGTRLIEETRRAAGPESMCLLIAAPGALSFYQTIGMPPVDNAFMHKREK